jgi:hypothetical protein
VALAAAIAFGLGGRDVAQDIIQKAYNRSNEVTGDSSSEGEGAGPLLTAERETGPLLTAERSTRA